MRWIFSFSLLFFPRIFPKQPNSDLNFFVFFRLVCSFIFLVTCPLCY
uniref:Uncharacterized protein n=1 Tax=Rhizophora mucronata TaxID=61149 RepID=A0A2P2KL75_RHIMU